MSQQNTELVDYVTIVDPYVIIDSLVWFIYSSRLIDAWVIIKGRVMIDGGLNIVIKVMC